MAIKFFDIIRRSYECDVVFGVHDRMLRPKHFPNYTESTSTEAMNRSANNTRIGVDACSTNSTIQHVVEISFNDDEPQSVSNIEHLANAVGLIDGANGMGTGFVISVKERLVLTASHVIEGNKKLAFIMNRGGIAMGVKVLWNNPKVDLAILQCSSLPSGARYFKIDSDVDELPKVAERIMHCGFLKGTEVSTNFFVYQGSISNYDPSKQLGERCFDAILSGIEATHGCSGGPVFRESDFNVIGALQGGFNDAPARIITDIHQLFNQSTLKIENYYAENKQ